MKLQLPIFDQNLIYHLISMIKLMTNILQTFHHHISSMRKLMTNILLTFHRRLSSRTWLTASILQASCHHLLLTPLLVILPMIFIHLLQQADLRIQCILSHTTINLTHRNLNSICHIITHLMKLPLTLTPTSSLTQVSQRAVSHQSLQTILLTIKALILPTVPSQLLPQPATRQLNTCRAAEMGLTLILPQLPLKHINMTAITNRHLRKLLRHTRLQDLQLELWHLMTYQLQWVT